MNCSGFNASLEQLVELRGSQLPEAAVAHLTDCPNCQRHWQDHKLLQSALVVWRPVVSAPSLVDAVLADLSRDQPSRSPGGDRRSGRRHADSRWMAVIAAACCLVAVLGLGLVMPPAGDSVSLKQSPESLPSEPPLEVASSVAAVLDDLQAGYRELAAETSATARELADALPPATSPTWETGFSTTARMADADSGATIDAPPGAVSLLGRSFGNQIGQAMDFLRGAVPDEVPRS